MLNKTQTKVSQIEFLNNDLEELLTALATLSRYNISIPYQLNKTIRAYRATLNALSTPKEETAMDKTMNGVSDGQEY